jgi:hypothetical protein
VEAIVDSYSSLVRVYWQMGDTSCSLSFIDGHPVTVLMDGLRLIALQPCSDASEALVTADRWRLQRPRRWPAESDLSP